MVLGKKCDVSSAIFCVLQVQDNASSKRLQCKMVFLALFYDSREVGTCAEERAISPVSLSAETVSFAPK